MDRELRIKIGQRLVGGFPGKEMSPEFIRLVKEFKISNVILFQYNVETGRQLQILCRSIKELVRTETGHGAFITIDQEGGVVTRLPEDSCNMPGAMAIAATGEPEYARLATRITADELKALGVNFNLAPIMDINNNMANPVIGVRSYGDTAETVETYGCAALEGYAEGGILAAVKHFPGHGDTAVDSHIGLPVIDKSLDELEELELVPFKAAIAKGVPAVMSSHILFPQLEPNQVPCTMSRRIITGLLKEKLGFQGLVVSDCLEMDAIKKYYGTAAGAVAAMAAGVDLLFISHSASLMEETAQAVYHAVSCGKLSMAQMEESAAKIIALKAKYAAQSRISENYGSEQARLQAADIRRKSIVLTQGSLFPLGDTPLFTGCADYRATLASNLESKQTSFPLFMERTFPGHGIVTGKSPDEKEIKEIVEAARMSGSIVMCTYNGHLLPGQMALVQALALLKKHMMVVALRNPYDLSDLPAHVTGIAAWEYTVMTMEILADILAGRYIPTGRMPVALHGKPIERKLSMEDKHSMRESLSIEEKILSGEKDLQGGSL